MKTEARSADEVSGPVQAWFLAARPRTLWAGVAPVLIGVAWALAYDVVHVPSALAALAGALLIQIGTNFCNDYADYHKGADTAERVGPLRATQSGLITPRAMGWATVLVFGLAALVGAYLVARGGWPLFWIATISIIAGVAYTAGPYALAYLGLGDVFVLIFFGPVAVAGTFYVQAGFWNAPVWWSGLAPGLLSCAILAVNNLRDIEQDRVARKRTLAVRFGRRFARLEYLGSVVLAIVVVPFGLWWSLRLPAIALLPVLSVFAVRQPLKRVLGGAQGGALNPALGETARTLLVFAVLFTIAWWRVRL
jgi:1,4-dihydroxy-2-naphthoate polyprenyltransferase